MPLNKTFNLNGYQAEWLNCLYRQWLENRLGDIGWIRGMDGWTYGYTDGQKDWCIKKSIKEVEETQLLSFDKCQNITERWQSALVASDAGIVLLCWTSSRDNTVRFTSRSDDDRWRSGWPEGWRDKWMGGLMDWVGMLWMYWSIYWVGGWMGGWFNEWTGWVGKEMQKIN